MPGFDRTGPEGQGPMTGRGMGPCGRGMAFRRGMGRGQGRGFGRGYGYRYLEAEPLSKEEQKKILEAELKQIEADKMQIERKLQELGK